MRICNECRKSNESNGQSTLPNCEKRKLNMKKNILLFYAPALFRLQPQASGLKPFFKNPHRNGLDHAESFVAFPTFVATKFHEEPIVLQRKSDEVFVHLMPLGGYFFTTKYTNQFSKMIEDKMIFSLWFLRSFG